MSYSLPEIFRKTIIVGAAVSLCSLAAFADDVIPYQASVSEGSAVLYAEDSADSEALADLESGDSVVILSNDTSGLQPAAWEDGDDVVSGYVDVEAFTPSVLDTASVIRSDVRLMQTPDREGEAVSELDEDAIVSILGYGDGWYFVRQGSKTGYVAVTDLDADVLTSDRLNLRSEPNTDSEKLKVLSRDTQLTPLSSDGEWLRVSVDDQIGYVCGDYVKALDEFVVEDPTKSTGEAVVAFAVQFEGNPYVWGGTSLTRGCDCSGFVMKVYEQFGISLPHSSASQRSCGYAVSRSEIQPGDVVCYSGHVGIYAGDGMIINALNSRVGIVYSKIDIMPVVAIRRML